MRKQELVQLHKLLSLVLDDIRSNTTQDLDEIFDLEEYNKMDVNPEGIHLNKSNQKEALIELSQTIGEGLDEHEDELKSMPPSNEEDKGRNNQSRYDQIKKDKERASRLAQTTNTSKGLESEDTDNQDSNDGPDWSQIQ